MKTKTILTPEVKSFPIKLNSFGNDYCVIYFHGLLGSSSHKHVLHLIDDLNKHKIDNCSFDFFAHGDRKEKESINDFDTYKYVEETKMVIHTLKNAGYKKFIFIGESLGGFLIQVLQSTKVDCIGIVFLFSVFDFTKAGEPSYETILKCYKNNLPLEVSSASGTNKAALSNRLLYGIVRFQEEKENLIEYQRDIPKLIINGKYDSSCEYESAIEFANNFDDAKLILFDTEHNGYDKDTKKYSYENTAKVNKEILKFIDAVTAVRRYFKKEK